MRTSPFRVVLVALGNDHALGVRHLHASLAARGVAASMLFVEPDYRQLSHGPWFSADIDSLLAFLGPGDRTLVGLSLVTLTFPQAVALSSALRARTSAKILWGGVHPTLCPEACLPHADALCLGDGEEVLAVYLDHLAGKPLEKPVPGLLLAGSPVPRQPMRAWRAELTSLPAPSYEAADAWHIRRGRFYRGDPLRGETRHHLIASRGCPLACSFCCNERLQGALGPDRRYRTLAPRRVLDDLHAVLRERPGISRVMFWDDIFYPSQAQFLEFCELYEQELGLPFFCHVHPQWYDRARLERLRRCGCEAVGIGLQCGSELLRREVYRRPESNLELAALCAEAADLGLDLQYDLIVDSPFENDADRMTTVDFLFHLPRPARLFLYPYTEFPGTVLGEGSWTGSAVVRSSTHAEDRVGREFQVALSGMACWGKRTRALARWVRHRRRPLARRSVIALARILRVVHLGLNPGRRLSWRAWPS